MTQKIPAEGEVFKGYVPASRQLVKVTIGSDIALDTVVGDAATYTLVEVSQPIVVFGMWTQVATAVTSSVTITLGDSDVADRFFASATIAPQSTGAVLVASSGLTVPYVYSAAQNLTATTAAATTAAGLVNVYLDYAILAE